ncbi:MAG TPA: small multi-drug export protein [Flavobacteriaceae bacterium]|nr:small multi-drug export protein [Flavobacteriaceae bacterium]
MILEIIVAMLWSISPFGEAKVGIPYAVFNGVNIYLAFIFCLAANILVFPIMLFFLDSINRWFFKWNFYKKSAVWVARRAKTNAQKGIDKYGFWGLVVFVMIPLPGTGVYAGTIAAYIFRFERKKAFIANSIGITLSSVIVWSLTVLSFNGIS